MRAQSSVRWARCTDAARGRCADAMVFKSRLHVLCIQKSDRISKHITSGYHCTSLRCSDPVAFSHRHSRERIVRLRDRSPLLLGLLVASFPLSADSTHPPSSSPRPDADIAAAAGDAVASDRDSSGSSDTPDDRRRLHSHATRCDIPHCTANERNKLEDGEAERAERQASLGLSLCPMHARSHTHSSRSSWSVATHARMRLVIEWR